MTRGSSSPSSHPLSVHEMAVAASRALTRISATRASELPAALTGLALSQEGTTTNGHVDRSTRDRQQSYNDAITILRERISTWVVVDILELF